MPQVPACAISVFLLVATGGRPDDPSSGGPGQIARTQAALGQFSTDDTDYAVPDGAIPLMTTLKHQLRDLVIAELNSSGKNASIDTDVQAHVLSNLESHGVNVLHPGIEVSGAGPGKDEYAYGRIQDISIRHPTSDPDLLNFTVTLGLPCGEDTSLYIVRRQGPHPFRPTPASRPPTPDWSLLIAREANGYKEISGALGRFQYYVEEPDTAGRSFVVTANVTPWCSSNWQLLRYQVARAGPDPYFPAVLLAAERLIFLGDDPAFQLEGEPSSFTLKFHGEYSLDGGILVRDHVLRYQVNRNRVLRVNPVASSTEDFLDEWVTMPWQDAARWSNPSKLSTLRRWHSFLHEKKSWSSDGLSFVQPCETSKLAPTGSSPTKWQIGLALYPKKPDDTKAAEIDTAQQPKTLDPTAPTGEANPLYTAAKGHEDGSVNRQDDAPYTDLPPNLFFTVLRQKNGFLMKRIDSARPPGCPGESPPAAFSRQ